MGVGKIIKLIALFATPISAIATIALIIKNARTNGKLNTALGLAMFIPIAAVCALLIAAEIMGVP